MFSGFPEYEKKKEICVFIQNYELSDTRKKKSACLYRIMNQVIRCTKRVCVVDRLNVYTKWIRLRHGRFSVHASNESNIQTNQVLPILAEFDCKIV
jgi:hypothetical protein